MIGQKHRVSVLAIATALGLGLAALSAAADQATSKNGPLTCAIKVGAAGTGIALASTVRADVALSGSYRFRVESAAPSGSSNFQQGGSFAAIPDSPVTLGRIMLGDAGSIYDATLEVSADGTTVICTKQVGGKI